MYIEPNTTIKLYKDVPIDKDYKHTLYFESIEKQNEFFHSGGSGTIAVLNRNYYTRVNRGRIRVQLPIGECYACNYIAFNNESFRNKWFYAFVTNVEYVNNETSELVFEIDVMQTYFFDVTLLESYVEREHTLIDTYDSNLIQENLNIDHYVRRNRIMKEYTAWSIILWSEYDADNKSIANGNIYGGIFQGMHAYIFNIIDTNGVPNESEINRFNNFATEVVKDNKQDSIISIQMLPRKFITNGSNVIVDPLAFDVTTFIEDIDGYIPKNKKLFSYPFNSVVCGTRDGQFISLRPEYIMNNTTLEAICTCSPTPELYFEIHHYNGMNINPDLNMSVRSFPKCSFAIDSFRAWIAQGGMANLTSEFLTGVTTSAVQAGMGNEVGAALTLTSTLAKTSIDLYTAYRQPPKQQGVSNSDALSAIHALASHYVEQQCINAQYAKRLDDFFSMYGYACKELKVPNRNARPHWTYTKTIGCNLNGNAPSDDLEKLVDIYDNGITFWNHYNEVGNYSLDNSPR